MICFFLLYNPLIGFEDFFAILDEICSIWTNLAQIQYHIHVTVSDITVYLSIYEIL